MVPQHLVALVHRALSSRALLLFPHAIALSGDSLKRFVESLLGGGPRPTVVTHARLVGGGRKARRGSRPDTNPVASKTVPMDIGSSADDGPDEEDDDEDDDASLVRAATRFGCRPLGGPASGAAQQLRRIRLRCCLSGCH